jgi:hypothetical protein
VLLEECSRGGENVATACDEVGGGGCSVLGVVWERRGLLVESRRILWGTDAWCRGITVKLARGGQGEELVLGDTA